jgi:FtsZ-binding cell division protein ZapB
MGNQTKANGSSSIAMGDGTIASGFSSTAMGNGTLASGLISTAMGVNTNAIGDYSTAIGNTTTASGRISLATGNETIASGDNSTAMGKKVNTNFKPGAFIIGDNDPNGEGSTLSGKSDEFVARFWNGYYFLTSGNNTRFGVQIGHNGNSWTSICDKNRKENFEPIDGDEVLQKIAKMNFTSWNYKMQDAKTYRHYGIMAQDFYNAFGHDKYGTIGNDTTVNPIDMIGIDMAAIQALEKRTTDLKIEIAALKDQNIALQQNLSDVDALKKENESLKQSVAQLQIEFKQQQKLVAQSLNALKALSVKGIAVEPLAAK